MGSDESSGLPVEGDVIDDTYHVESVIGEGGMGVVYRAYDLARRAHVALKVVRPELASEVDLARFRREAELAARVDDQAGAVRVHAFGMWRGVPYCAMELVEGDELATLMKENALDSMGVARILERVARTLGRCHEKGVIHRDLKPANILIRESSGNPTILDFGVAHALNSERLTQTGELVGTPGYMAPEQLSGEGMGPHTDVYALGVILYEALTRQQPFKGSLLQILDKVANEEPLHPSRVDSQVSPGLEAICLRALAKRPEQRYASADSFADDLLRALRGEPVEATIPTRWGRFMNGLRRSEPAALTTLLAAVVAVLVTLLGAIAFAQRYRLERQEARVVEAALALDERTRAWNLGVIEGSAEAPSEAELEAALASLPVGVDDPLRRRLMSYQFLLAHRAGNAPDPTGLASTLPTEQVVQALVLADRGQRRQAHALVVAARGALAQAPWLAPVARAVERDVVVRLAGDVALEAVGQDVPDVRARAEWLASAARPCGLDDESGRAAIAASIKSALEKTADEWRGALRQAYREGEAKGTTRVLERLEPLLRGEWEQPPGPELGRALEEVFERFAAAFEASGSGGLRGDARLGLALVHIEAALLYRVWIQRPLNDRFRRVVEGLTYQTDAVLLADAEFAFAIVRVGVPAVSVGGLGQFRRTVPKQDQQRVIAARPRSRAVRYWRYAALTGGSEARSANPWVRHQENVDAGRRVFEDGVLDDLGHYYERKVCQGLARDLLNLASAPEDAFTAEQRQAWGREALGLVRTQLSNEAVYPMDDPRDLRELLTLEAQAVGQVEGQDASDRYWAAAEKRLRARVKATSSSVGRGGMRLVLVRFLLDKAHSYARLDRWPELVALVREAQTLFPDDFGTHHSESYALLAQNELRANRFDAAEAILAPGYGDHEELSFRYGLFAVCATQAALGQNRLKEAARRAALGLRRNPDSGHLRVLREQIAARLAAQKGD